jgi:hypothetical protein
MLRRFSVFVFFFSAPPALVEFVSLPTGLACGMLNPQGAG